MRHHKALFLNEKRGCFLLGDKATPAPGAGELLVEVEAVGLNLADYQKRQGTVELDSYPAIIGTDAAGVVVGVGDGVKNFAVGDRVMYQGGQTNDRACFQQYNIVDAVVTMKIPNHMSFESAASIPTCFTATFFRFYNPSPHGADYTPPFNCSAVKRYSGQSLFVFGGDSCEGQFAVQLGRISGFSPIITTSSLEHSEHLRSLGATHIIDRDLPPNLLLGSIKEMTNIPPHLVYDTVATPHTQEVGLEILAPHGQLMVVRDTEVESNDELRAAMHRKLGEWLEDGTIRPNKIEILPAGLESVMDGLNKLGRGKVSGKKLIVRPQLTGSSVNMHIRRSQRISLLGDNLLNPEEKAEVRRGGSVKKVRIKLPIWKRIMS